MFKDNYPQAPPSTPVYAYPPSQPYRLGIILPLLIP